MSIFKTYNITPAGLVLILAILLLSGVTRMSKKSWESLDWVAVTMIFLGLVFSDTSEWLGYACYGIGLVIALVEFFRGRKAAADKEAGE